MPRRPKTPRFKEFQRLANTRDQSAGSLKLDPGPYQLELGCGRGEFVLELARRHRRQQFVGVDIKSDRMWFGAKRAEALKVNNLLYLRSDIRNLAEIFPRSSVKMIWLTFPDPYPKERQAKHRLTHPSFMELYHELLISGGQLRLKTDSDGLWAWSKAEFLGLKDWQVLASGQDLHADFDDDSDWRILTQYEQKFLAAGQTINYIELRKI